MLFLIKIITMIMVLVSGSNIIYHYYNWEQPKIVSQGKVIVITIAIKDNLPLKAELNVSKRYFLEVFTPQITLVKVINNLPLSVIYFDILSLNLQQNISTDYELTLIPKPPAIQFYRRFDVPLNVLVNLGLNFSAAQKIITLCQNRHFTSDELITNIKKALPLVKKKYFAIMQKFIIF